MARRVFYSFHYDADHARASQVRNIGMIDGNRPATDNEWEQVKRGGTSAVQRWIDNQLNGRSCTIVLIGQNTAGRPWINYEIEKSWTDGKGLFGIYIHNLKNLAGFQSLRGSNPFDGFTMRGSATRLAQYVAAYDPPYSDSRLVYAYIAANLTTWIDVAVRSRGN